MTWAMLISVLIEILKQRAAAGWPLLNELLKRWGIRIQNDADTDVSPITVGAAPQELKDQIVAWLEAKKATAGIGMKFVYTIVIRAVPLVADQIWDKLFSMNQVSQPASAFPPVVQGLPEEDESAILCDVL